MDPPRKRTDWLRVRQHCLAEALRVLNREDAEEAAQEALLRAWRYRGARRSAGWVPWVRTIARNEALRIAGQRRRFAQREVHEHAEPPDPAGASELEGVVESVSVEALLRPLKQHERDLLRLRYEEDLTNLEISRRLGMPEGTVKVRLHRLRGRLKAGFEQGKPHDARPGVSWHEANG
jgi:RNA polymerase sigma-70 factor, ECF subfamily